MKKKLIPLSKLNRYMHAIEGRPVRNGESALDAVAASLCARHGLQRGPANARAFVESHRELVFAGARQWSESAQTAPVVAVVSNAASDAFLASFEWRRVRMLAIKKYGACCQCCGASPATGAVINVDHIKPRRLFPELALDLNNLQVLCADCNHGKGNWDMTDWRGATSKVP